MVVHRGLHYCCLPPVGKKLCFRSAAGLFHEGIETKPWRCRTGDSLCEDRGFQTPAAHPPVAKTGRDLEREMLETSTTSRRSSGPSFVYCRGMKCIAGIQGVCSVLLLQTSNSLIKERPGLCVVKPWLRSASKCCQKYIMNACCTGFLLTAMYPVLLKFSVYLSIFSEIYFLSHSR